MSPLHPVLVHFPIALFTVSLGADILGRLRTGGASRVLGFWCLVLATLGAALAVAAGFSDMARADLAEATHRFVHLHRDIGSVLLAGLLSLTAWRWWVWHRRPPADRVGWPYLLAAGAVFALLVFQGWFGGQLVYGLGAGVSAAGQGVVSPEEGQLGLAPFSALTEEVHEHPGHAH